MITFFYRCENDIANGNHKTEDCLIANNRAASLDKLDVNLSMPQHLFNKILSRPKNDIIRNSNHTDYIAYNINVVADGNRLNATYKEKGTKSPKESIKIQKWMKEIFPINTRHSMLTKMVNKYMGSSFQGQCLVQPDRLTTFDQVEYNYSMNDCEHVVVIEKSQPHAHNHS